MNFFVSPHSFTIIRLEQFVVTPSAQCVWTLDTIYKGALSLLIPNSSLYIPSTGPVCHLCQQWLGEESIVVKKKKRPIFQKKLLS